MTLGTERTLSLAAIAVAVCFLAGVAGWRLPVPGGRISSGSATGYFHEGKPAGAGMRDSSCRTEKCHGAYPHGKGLESAFRNMHAEFVDCPVCHGREGKAEWSVEAGGGDRWRIRSGTPPAAGDPHASFGTPVRCRECHSQAGRERIERGGTRKLQGTFNDPIALRMLEEGSRKWMPEGM